MGLVTGISWCHSTFNCWIGCSKVSQGCKFCYAETLNNRWNGGNWGPGAPRRITSDANWKQPIKWNKDATKSGKRHRVFCASLADVFDDEAPEGGRERLWGLIEATPNLDWLLLTKRTDKIIERVPKAWLDSPLDNVWYGTSVENDAVKVRIDMLREVPAKVRFLSVEPMIGDINYPASAKDISWMIFGGESGNQARRMGPQRG
jgi:protein gp37